MKKRWRVQRGCQIMDTHPGRDTTTSFWRRTTSSRHSRSATSMSDIMSRIEETAEVESGGGPVKSTIPTPDRQLPRLQRCSPAREGYPKGFDWRRLHFLHHSTGNHRTICRRFSCPDNLAALTYERHPLSHDIEDDVYATKYEFPVKSTFEKLADDGPTTSNAFENRPASSGGTRRRRSWLFSPAQGERACLSSLPALPPAYRSKFCSRHHTRQSEPSQAPSSSPCSSWSSSSKSSPSVSPQNSFILADKVTPRKLDLCHPSRPSSPFCKPPSHPPSTVPPNPESIGVKGSSSDVCLNGVDVSLLHLLLASFLGCIAIFPPKHLMVLPVIWRSFAGASLIVVSLASLLLIHSNGQRTAGVGYMAEEDVTQEPRFLNMTKFTEVEEVQASSKNRMNASRLGILECCGGLDLFALPVLLAVFGFSVMANSDPSRVAVILLLVGLSMKGGVLLSKAVAAFSTRKIGNKPAWWLWVAKVLKAKEEWDKLKMQN